MGSNVIRNDYKMIRLTKKEIRDIQKIKHNNSANMEQEIIKYINTAIVKI